MFAKAEKKVESSSPYGAVELLKAGPALSEPTPKKLSRTKPGAGVTKLQTARPAKGVVSNAKASQIPAPAREAARAAQAPPAVVDLTSDVEGESETG